MASRNFFSELKRRNVYKVAVALINNEMRRWPFDRPLVWAFSYLLLIPLFACLYQCQPRGFYHTTVIHEQRIADDLREIERDLESGLKKAYREKHSSDLLSKDDIRFDVKTMQVSNLRIATLSSELALICPYTYNNGLEHDVFGFSVELHGPMGNFGVRGEEYTLLDEERPNLAKPFSIYDLFPISNRPLRTTDKTFSLSGFVYLPMTVGKKMRAYRESLAGFPRNASGNFWRMLYFSAITITTVGYGDIIPMTNSARLLVAGEAVLGIVVAGLFLNAIAKSARARPRPQPKSSSGTSRSRR